MKAASVLSAIMLSACSASAQSNNIGPKTIHTGAEKGNFLFELPRAGTYVVEISAARNFCDDNGFKGGNEDNLLKRRLPSTWDLGYDFYLSHRTTPNEVASFMDPGIPRLYDRTSGGYPTTQRVVEQAILNQIKLDCESVEIDK